MTILITGSTGLLGPYLMDWFAEDSQYGDEQIFGVARTPKSGGNLVCDLTSKAYTQKTMDEVNPRIIIHAAALTNIDKCEKSPELAIQVNVEATRNIVQTMPPDCRLIYISTDMVYSGNAVPHCEYSISESPLNMYGLSKYLGEFEAMKAKNSLVVRTNIYGRSRTQKSSSLADFILAGLHGNQPLPLFNDVMFSPLHVRTLSQMVAELANMKVNGVHNLGCRGGCSKLGFGILLAQTLGLPTNTIRSVASTSAPGRITRPLDTRLDCTFAEGLLGPMPLLQDDIINMRDETWKD